MLVLAKSLFFLLMGSMHELDGATLHADADHIVEDACGIEDVNSFLQVSKTVTRGGKVPDGVSQLVDDKQGDGVNWLPPKLAAAAAPPTLVLVRTYIPLTGMRQRIADWAEDLHRHQGSTLKLMTSLDETNLRDPWGAMIKQNLTRIPYTFFHQTQMKEIKKHYPVWEDMVVRHQDPWLLGKTWKPSGWDTHTEFVLLAAQEARRKGFLTDDNGYVWVFEDDLGICGSMSEMIAYYANNTADFIFSHSLHPLKERPKDWPHYCEGSDAFLNMYPPEKRWYAAEHVVRFSLRFLSHLDALIREAKVTAHSEMFPPTVCMNSDVFTCATMSEKHFFPSRLSWHDTRINETTWEEACPHNQVHSPPRLAHALKW